jgi:hypothetical protein
MKIRKIAVLGGFAAGAALTLAPIASADDLTSVLDGEIGSLNGIFVGEAALAGDSGDVTTNAAGFDVVPLADAPDSGTPTTLDYELYGLNPIANAASDPGSYNVFNGAVTEFYDADNVVLGSALNDGTLDTNVADYFGSSSVIDAALGSGATETSAFTTFFDAGLADLAGYFDIGSFSL